MVSAAKCRACAVRASHYHSRTAGQRTRRASYFNWLFLSRWSSFLNLSNNLILSLENLIYFFYVSIQFSSVASHKSN